MKAKNCLIFGGSGQIGSFLIRKLTKNNLKVTVVTRNIHQKGLKIKTQANAGYIDIVEANIFDEEKIQRQEQIDDIIFDKFKERAESIDQVHKDLTEEIRQTEKRLLIEIKQLKVDIGGRVGTLEKFKWLILGGAIVIGWILSSNFKMIIEMMS